jgi:phage terminase small subunit
MARQSVDAKAAAIWRTGGEHPQPPRFLSSEARKLWQAIVEDRPTDYFRPGSLELLEGYCEMVVAQRKNLKLLAADPANPDVIKVTKDLALVLNSTAVKLRLAVSSTSRPVDGKLVEREPSGRGAKGVTRWLSGDIAPGARAN